MKRKLSAAIAVVSLVAIACGGGASPQPTQGVASTPMSGSSSAPASTTATAEVSGELKVVYWNSDPQVSKDLAVDDFTRLHPGVTVKLIPLTADNWGTYLAGVATLIAGGEKPDVIWVASEGLQFVVKHNLVRPIDDLIQQDQADFADYSADVAQPLIDGFKVDGKQYMLPNTWEDMVMFYNKARFQEAGLQPPAADWTRADFLAAAKALTADTNGDGQPDKFGFAFDNGGLFGSLVPWVYANGGALLSEDGCSATVNSPEVVDAVSFMHDLIYVDKVSPAPTGLDIFSAFQKGDVAMFGAGRWPVSTFVPAGFTDFDIQVWPQNKAQRTEFGTDGIAIFRDSPNPEAAWAYLKFRTTKAVQEKIVGTAAAPLTAIPARRSVADGLKQFPPANAGAFYGAIDSGAAKMVPAPAEFNVFESTILRYTGLVLANEMSPADAMTKAQDDLKTVVTCP